MIKNTFIALVVVFAVVVGLIGFQSDVYAVSCNIDGNVETVETNEECTSRGGVVEAADDTTVTDVKFDAEKPSGAIGSGEVNFSDRSGGAGKFYGRLINYVNIASIGVGVLAAVGVAIAGLQYATARGEPGKTAAAVKRLTQAGTAIFLYIFGWVILNWLIPGGILNDAEIIPELGWLMRLS